MAKWSMGDIKKTNAEKGFFFSKGAMDGFSSIVYDKVFEGEHGVFFVTSEQFIPSQGPAEKRKYTVRQFFPDTGRVNTVGAFNKLATKTEAMQRARECAAFGPEAKADTGEAPEGWTSVGTDTPQE